MLTDWALNNAALTKVLRERERWRQKGRKREEKKGWETKERNKGRWTEMKVAKKRVGKERGLAKNKGVRLDEKILSQFYNSCCLVETCSFGHSLTGRTETTHPMQLSCI